MPNRKPAFLSAVLLSLVLLIPCFWQPIVSSVDLQSHLYNAWLCDLIQSGKMHGLQIASQRTNIVFDIAASKLLPSIGVSATERLLTASMVLLMFWGIYWLIDRIAGQTAGWMIPWIAVLCYGYVFQIGFSNYFISTGICFFALVLAWDGPLWRILVSLPLLAFAYLAHPIPVLWAIGFLVYAFIAKKLSGKWQGVFLAVALIGLEFVNLYIRHHFEINYTKRQLLFVTGADQVWLVGWAYVLVSAVLMLLIAIALVDRVRSHGLTNVSAQMYLLTAFAIGFMPNSIGHPGQAAAALIPQRVSLLAVVLLLAVASGARAPRWYLGVSLAAAAVFFAVLYRDTGRESRAEQKMHALVATLPPGQRVLYYDRTHFYRPNESVLPTDRLYSMHLISRACIETCFDYMDYEPATEQFRIRALPGNGFVTASSYESYLMQAGLYAMRASDLPAYAVLRCPGDRFELYAFREGQTTNDLPCK